MSRAASDLGHAQAQARDRHTPLRIDTLLEDIGRNGNERDQQAGTLEHG